LDSQEKSGFYANQIIYCARFFKATICK